MQAQRDLTLRIFLLEPPPGVDFGVQMGQGARYTTVQTQRSTGKDLRFEITVSMVAMGKELVDFRGPAVQGKKGERFIYIDIGTYAGQSATHWSRRLKIPLVCIAGDAEIFETRVPGTGRDGGPTCGTVKPFSGWKPV